MPGSSIAGSGLQFAMQNTGKLIIPALGGVVIEALGGKVFSHLHHLRKNNGDGCFRACARAHARARRP